MTDLASGTKEYVNKATGEVVEDPPDEVLEFLASENARKRPPRYGPTSYRFAPLSNINLSADMVHECCCCKGAGVVENLGTCPLCEGKGHFDSDADGDDSDIGTSPALVRPPRSSDVLPIQKVDFLDDCFGYDGACFVLLNLLSPAECQAIIDQAEDFGLESCGYSSRMRITDRVLIMGEELGEVLFERAKPWLPDMHLSSDLPKLPAGLPQDIPLTGQRRHWSATGLNPCFRVCRYKPGGFFQPHHDGGFDLEREHRSFKTFMLYLNDDFDGGSTNFYKPSQKHYVDPDPSKVMKELRPQRGSCLVFNHCITHDGGILKGGTKYILRTEVMYRLSY
jgi:hypothetical protein